MDLFKHTDWKKLIEFLGLKIFHLVVTTILFYILYKLCRKIISQFFKNYAKKSWSDTAWTMTFSRISLSALQYVTLFLYVYTILDIVGIPTSKLLAGAGFFGVVLSLIGHDLLSDIITGFFIIFENQANVGDYISIVNMPPALGYVESVGIRSLTIVDCNGAKIYVPNHNIQSIRNFSKQEYKVFVDLPTPNINNPDYIRKQVLAINEQIYESNKDIFLEKPIYLGIQDLAASGLYLRTVAFVKYEQNLKAQNLLLEQYIKINLIEEKEGSDN
ncbi:mechanosensitive ion channel [Streptococcaceae bacterium ESL0687]|nr:mechanosensitive ion channel [Streptococcaceae bacterium ESL0687]